MPDELDQLFDRIIEEEGGWSKVLHPSFAPSKELYSKLAEVGCSKSVFDEIRSKYEKPKKEIYIQMQALYLYNVWKFLEVLPPAKLCLLAPGAATGIKWTDIETIEFPSPVNIGYWDRQKKLMLEYGITRDEVEQFMVSHPLHFPSLKSHV